MYYLILGSSHYLSLKSVELPDQPVCTYMMVFEPSSIVTSSLSLSSSSRAAASSTSSVEEEVKGSVLMEDTMIGARKYEGVWIWPTSQSFTEWAQDGERRLVKSSLHKVD
jgi:hypothetical protein